jgi:copper transport protein
VFTAAADTAHLLAMAVWLGGLVVLAVFVLAGNKITVEDATEVSERFSRTALISVGVLIVSGVVIAVKELVGTPDLAGSRYAELLLFKLAAFGLLLCVATLSRAVVRARFQTSQPAQRVSRRRGEATKQAQQVRRLRRTVSGEVAIAGVVLAVAALLVATPPTERSVGPAPVAAHSGPYLDALALPSSGDVQVWVEPASAGDNQVAINVRDERGVNRDVPEVSAKLSLSARGVGPIPVPLTRTQAGQFVADRIAIPMAGEWHLEISVRTTDFDQSTVDTDVPVS